MAVIGTVRGHGDVDFGRSGFGRSGLDYVVLAETNLALQDVIYDVRSRVTSVARFKSTKIKNISNRIIWLHRVPDIPDILKKTQLMTIKLRPLETKEIAIDAYDIEKIRELRDKLKLLVDPVR